LGGRGPSLWDIHLILRTFSEPQSRQTTPCLAGCNICLQDSWAPASVPRYRVHVWVPWSCPRGWTTLKIVAPFLTLFSLTLNSLAWPFPSLCPERP
jgi:hypothetical protein